MMPTVIAIVTLVHEPYFTTRDSAVRATLKLKLKLFRVQKVSQTIIIPLIKCVLLQVLEAFFHRFTYN